MQTKFQGHLTGAVIQDRIDEGHDGRLQREVVLVDAQVLVEVVDDALEASAFHVETLKVQHRFQDLSVPTWDQAHCPEDFQDRDLGLDVLCGQRLGDCVDGC